MARLANELSWSRSRMSTFANCRRQYYWQYYGKWGGWEWNADSETKQAYLLSKMTDLPMMVGTAVHETIKLLLEEVRDFGAVRNADPERLARQKMTDTWRAAEDRQWMTNLKRNPPVFELYYGPPPDREVLKQLGSKAAKCVLTFLESELFAELVAEGGSNWLAIDEGATFSDDSKLKLGGRTVWALPDFVRQVGDVCEIWDWKTGSKNPFDGMQILSYALYARDKWRFDPAKIRLMCFYLADGEVVNHPCDADRLLGMERQIQSDFETLGGLVKDGNLDRNAPRGRDEAFPMIEDLEVCRRCCFKELCGRG